MKILLLCNKVPYPANDGSSIAMRSMIDGLLQNHAQVSALCLNTPKHYRQPADVEAHQPAGLDLEVIDADTSITLPGAFRNLLNGEPYHVSRFFQADFAKALCRKLGETDYDIVQAEGLSMAIYLELIHRYSKAKVVLRAHNVEHLIWERHLPNERHPLKRRYLQIQVKRLKQFEKTTLEKIDGLAAISRDDLRTLSGYNSRIPAISIPCGVNIQEATPCRHKAPGVDIGYLASFDWFPNVQSARWFIEKVWPIVEAQKPGITFHLGGRHMPKVLKNLATRKKGVTLLENVPEMREFVCNTRLMIVPLLAGSGIRIKVIENMALGKAMISTTIGAEGVLYTPGKDLAIADTPEDFAEKTIHYLENNEARLAMGQAARKTIERHYDNRKLGAELLNFFASQVC